LVALGGRSSDETVVCQHGGADSWAAGSDGVARGWGSRKLDPEGPGTWWCLRKLMEQATIAGVQDSRRAVESRSDHPGEEKCAARDR
jgi:hypothetical protein